MLRAPVQGAKALIAASASAARTTRGSVRVSSRRLASSGPPAASGATTKEKDAAHSAEAVPKDKGGVRSPDATFTIEPKPATGQTADKKKTKGHKIRNTTLLALVAGSGFVAAAAYANEDREFGLQFENYVPGARSFMQLVRHHDNSVVMAASDVGYSAYDTTVYTGRFIYQQLQSLLNMLQHNSWHAPEGGSAKAAVDPPKPRAAPTAQSASATPPPSDTNNKAGSGAKDGAAPLTAIRLAVEIPPLESDCAAVAELSTALSVVVQELNKRGLAPENVQQLKTLSDTLLRLDKYFDKLKGEERAAVEAALTEERLRFDGMLTEIQDAARKALLAREAQLTASMDELLRDVAVAADERLAKELAAQRDLLERRFNRFVRARVDEERGGRLAHLDRVEAQLHQLVQMARESGDVLRRSQAVARLGVAVAALKNAAAGHTAQQPFASELVALAGAATTDFPATRAAVMSIPRDAAEQGVPSQVELEGRFEAVRKEIRSVALVPENGSVGSQVLSVVLSKAMFEKEGLVGGDDVDAVLARAAFYLKQHNLDMAARELNQLTGWPGKLAEDWVAAARRRLEIEQAIGVAEAEEQLARLALV
ncbi:hypothetical protein LPJ61_002910 [Coemansia biformis]|uniref:MICOS complex subunit MIC60 n=1 Tax=Coemansia biformis TaxID=1286918 RepID=A0A9W8CWR7_9FUNG|nr:hypothetical protein LPJ61_002910 [Coemansia biformis]